VRWLYKIWGGYDGFRPSQIEHRMLPGGALELGWAKYADAVVPGEEVWVWFYEGTRFTPGVYAKGVVKSIDPLAEQVVIDTQHWATTQPLTSPGENALLANIVAPRYRQVFVLPDTFRQFDACTATLPSAPSCAAHQCDYCSFWRRLPQISRRHVSTPDLLVGRISAFAPAYWVVAPRSFAWNASTRLLPGVRRTTEMFYRFKTGEASLAYPLAKGMAASLVRNNAADGDAIVPIPLSPDKVKAKEINRTRLLSDALSGLTQVPVVDALKLTTPIGKRVAINAGLSDAAFRTRYVEYLDVDASQLSEADRIILVDDVCTRGNTLFAVIRALRKQGIKAEISVSVAGQMTIRAAVRNDGALLRPRLNRASS
jgi:hypothetical protein